ncbi:MAG: alpha/beta fold hydrolase [Deltaproteobacteria bacterium]|nr:alpha/beta fold hydrolase [Deltaproteobacteria bacterium]MBW2308277.1 alpha/beta fold hydrolase [Deltaproteobacteria bacterium]
MIDGECSGQVRKVRLSSGGVSLAGEVHTPDNPRNALLPGLIICHGIPAARAVGGDGGYSELAGRFARAGFLTMIFNFRGTGESGGNFDIRGWMEDLDTAISYLMAAPRVDQARFSLMGFSAGAAVSLCLAAEDRRVGAVVACASPARWERIGEWASADSYLAHARDVGIVRDSDFPPDIDQWWKGFKQVVPVERIGRISPRPLFIIHGDKDEVVPPRHADELFDRAGEPREVRWIPGEGHRLRLSQPAMDAAMNWLREVNGLERPS